MTFSISYYSNWASFVSCAKPTIDVQEPTQHVHSHDQRSAIQFKDTHVCSCLQYKHWGKLDQTRHMQWRPWIYGGVASDLYTATYLAAFWTEKCRSLVCIDIGSVLTFLTYRNMPLLHMSTQCPGTCMNITARDKFYQAFSCVSIASNRYRGTKAWVWGCNASSGWPGIPPL